MVAVLQATVLNRHEVTYHQCSVCGFLSPEEPHWLEEAYSEAIASTDVGLVYRNRFNWRRVEPVLALMFGAESKFLDVGGGYGLLCRGLRDDGFDCYTTDEYCQNLFAKEFEPGPGFQADALLAFEVMEHITDPLRFVREAFEKYGCKTLIFSTLTHDGEGPPPLDWWYYAFETGQHVSLYHRKSLEALAAQLGVELWSLSDEFHVLSDRLPSPLVQRLLKFRKVFAVYSRIARRQLIGRSKLEGDYERAKAALKKSKE